MIKENEKTDRTLERAWAAGSSKEHTDPIQRDLYRPHGHDPSGYLGDEQLDAGGILHQSEGERPGTGIFGGKQVGDRKAGPGGIYQR